MFVVGIAHKMLVHFWCDYEISSQISLIFESILLAKQGSPSFTTGSRIQVQEECLTVKFWVFQVKAKQRGSSWSCQRQWSTKWLQQGGQMDGLLLPRRKEMGEIMESKIRKKDKVMSGRVGVGWVSLQWNLRRAHACTRREERMKSETDRQSCMSWLVSCSFIGMQISCIQEHLGVFRSLVSSSLLCSTSPSTFPFSSTKHPFYSSSF